MTETKTTQELRDEGAIVGPIVMSPDDLMEFALCLHDKLMLFDAYRREVYKLLIDRTVQGLRLAFITRGYKWIDIVIRTGSEDTSEVSTLLFGGALQAWLTKWGPFDPKAEAILNVTAIDRIKGRVYFGDRYIEEGSELRSDTFTDWLSLRVNAYIVGNAGRVNSELLRSDKQP